MPVKQLYIIRHGETEYNRLNIVQGSGVDMGLNEIGQQQAALFFEAYRNHRFDAVYTSALKRSQQSVAGFIQKGIKHVALPGLNEISWGDFEGKQQTPEQKEAYWNLIHSWNNGDFEAKIPNGESPNEMQQRQRGAIQHILSNTDEKEVLICMHGRAMKSLLCLLLNEPLTSMDSFTHSNLCLYQLTYDNGMFELKEAHNTKHLDMS
jgi:probable phosphoglycerate mutase